MTDMETDLGNILNEGYESVTAEPEAAAPDAVADTPGGEAPTSPEGPGSPAPSTPGGEGPTSEYQMTEDGTSYLVPKTELPVLNGFKQYASEVQAIFPTANDAKTAYQDSADLRAMTNDFANGTDEDLVAFLNHFAGFDHAKDPTMQAQYQARFAAMAQKMPDVLAKVSPEAHSALVSNFVNGQIEKAYDQAREYKEDADASGYPGDQRYADIMLQRAQQMEWGATGKVRGEYDAQSGVYKYDFQKKADAQPANQLSPREAEIAAREAAALDRDYKYFDANEFHGPMWKDYFAELDKALAPIKDRYTPDAFDDLREGVNQKLLKAMSSDNEWLRMNTIERNAITNGYKQLWQKGQPITALKPRIAAYRADLLAKARQLLPAIAKARINPATAKAVAQSARAASAPTRPTQQAPAQPAVKNGRPMPYDRNEDPEWNDLFKLPA